MGLLDKTIVVSPGCKQEMCYINSLYLCCSRGKDIRHLCESGDTLVGGAFGPPLGYGGMVFIAVLVEPIGKSGG